MRRLLLTVLAGLIVVPAAFAANTASGDGVLELNGVYASNVTILGKGVLWGQLDEGKLIVTDFAQGDGDIYVSGAEHMHNATDQTTAYWGQDIHFRITGGRYRIVFKPAGTDSAAENIDLTAVGVGTAQLTGDPNATSTGQFAIDSGKWFTVPLVQKSVTFGVQPLTLPIGP